MNSVNEWTPLLLPGHPEYIAAKHEIPQMWLYQVLVPKAKKLGKHIVTVVNQQTGRSEYKFVDEYELARYNLSDREEEMRCLGVEGFW